MRFDREATLSPVQSLAYNECAPLYSSKIKNVRYVHASAVTRCCHVLSAGSLDVSIRVFSTLEHTYAFVWRRTNPHHSRIPTSVGLSVAHHVCMCACPSVASLSNQSAFLRACCTYETCQRSQKRNRKKASDNLKLRDYSPSRQPRTLTCMWIRRCSCCHLCATGLRLFLPVSFILCVTMPFLLFDFKVRTKQLHAAKVSTNSPRWDETTPSLLSP